MPIEEDYPKVSSADSDIEIAPGTVAKITKASNIITVLVAGLALFSDGYNAQIIGYMEPLFSELYADTMSKSIKTRLSNAYLIGEIFGMLFFGFAIDRLGRRTGIIFATLFLVLGIVLATAAHGTTDLGMFWMMIIGRGVAGFGAGGEYPTCATGATESADETPAVRRRRGILVAISTDFAIDFGFVIAGVVALIVLAAYHHNVSEGVWRVSFGLGFVLPVILFFFRIRMIESSQYRKHAIKHKIPYWLAIKRYWKPMLGTSLAWFFYDFVTYPFGLFSSTIIAQLNPNNTLTQNIGLGTAVNCFYLPGCLVGGLLMDRIGRKQTMTLGFFLWAALGFIIGGALHPIQSVLPLFIVLYGIFNAFGEMGPGVATFLCGAESFPTPVRGHFLGFAAAVGKAGSAIGTQVFMPIQDSFGTTEKGTQAEFLIGAAFATVGGIIAWFLVPDRERDLEDEDAKFREYLAANGYDGVFGESLLQEVKSTAWKLGGGQ
ncbi:MFS general substrate transporter [Aulographum hederae CBS 113979]|uniref:MFS general substrate transporter n=1 Tax=Aulographum hederae CBS 113979 TaxID=1176131 RepID=A0A6G1GJ53_9PEZI|nr:MFS general substrate transporter [Aulographum hederae CBS 113979]